MNSPAVTQIPKIDYTTTSHPSGVKALSLKDAPALIESLLPVQKLSVDVYRERTAGPGQTLTALGSYWKGRKPLVLNRACVLASLLPATEDPIKDLAVFELLMGMDDISMSKRIGLAKPADIVRHVAIHDIGSYFSVAPPEQANALPMQGPFDIEGYTYLKKGVQRVPKLTWRVDVSEDQKHELAAGLLHSKSYREIAGARGTSRAEEIADRVSTHIWPSVNAHLGTKATSFPELVEQLGVMRFGHRPTVADTFSGSGQISFAAAQLGCDAYASDLNPISCALTWGSLHIVGGATDERKTLEQLQCDLVESVKNEFSAWCLEDGEDGWIAKVFLYCLEVICPSSGWKVPLLPNRIVSTTRGVWAELIPDPKHKRYDIALRYNASTTELEKASKGTVEGGDLVHTVDGVPHRTSISAIRGDYFVTKNGRRVINNKLRPWTLTDVVFKPDDIFNERLYAIQWMKYEGAVRPTLKFASVTTEDVKREESVLKLVQKNLSYWQQMGWIPDSRIEAGEKTDEPIRTRGWTHWHHLFNPRQLLLAAMVNKHSPAALKFGFTRILNQSCRLSRWDNAVGSDKVQGVFDNQALNTLYNFGVRASSHALDLTAAKFKSVPLPANVNTIISNHPANGIQVPVDIFVTDPPYGDAVKYEEILEFFIAWLRKNPPAEFANWTWDSRRELAVKGEDHDFRLSMVAAYKRMAECMPDNGIQVLMFTHQDGNIWADLANIVWASGLHVTAAWYVVTETDSALRGSSNIKGTILLVLRKRLGATRTNQTDLAYELEEEVFEQLKRLTGMNDAVTSDVNRAKDGNLFEDADLQMAGYAAALKVLTKYSIIDGKNMMQEALRPRVAGQTSLVEGLIEYAVNTANKALFPRGLPESVWHDLEPAERFYLKMLEQESHGLNTLDNYQNFAKAFAVKNLGAMMASEKANKAALRTAKEFAKSEMNQSSELFETPTRAVLYALMDLQAGKDLDIVLKGLEQNLKVGTFLSARDTLVAIARFVAKMVAVMRSDEASAARVLADGIENQKM